VVDIFAIKDSFNWLMVFLLVRLYSLDYVLASLNLNRISKVRDE